MRHSLAALAVIGLLILPACTGLQSPPEEPSTTSAAPSVSAAPSLEYSATPEDAIRALLAKDSIVYADECAETDLETDINKYCSTITRNEGDTVTVIIGPTFSEYIAELTLTREAGGWRVTDERPIDYPGFPATMG